MIQNLSIEDISQWLRENPNEVFCCNQLAYYTQSMMEPIQERYDLVMVAQFGNTVYVANEIDIEIRRKEGFTKPYIRAYPYSEHHINFLYYKDYSTAKPYDYPYTVQNSLHIGDYFDIRDTFLKDIKEIINRNE